MMPPPILKTIARNDNFHKSKSVSVRKDRHVYVLIELFTYIFISTVNGIRIENQPFLPDTKCVAKILNNHKS